MGLASKRPSTARQSSSGEPEAIATRDGGAAPATGAAGASEETAPDVVGAEAQERPGVDAGAALVGRGGPGGGPPEGPPARGVGAPPPRNRASRSSRRSSRSPMGS